MGLRPCLLRTIVLLVLPAGCGSSAGQRAPAQAGTYQLQHRPIRNRLQLDFGELKSIQVHASFKYVTGSRFTLGQSADAEQHLFVVADSNLVIDQLLWIQIERRLAADSGVYRYDADSVVALQGLSFFRNVRTYSTPPDPSSDRGKAFALLNSAGYRLPDGATRLRLIYLPERPARRELMIIYLEPNQPSGDSLFARAGRALRLSRN